MRGVWRAAAKSICVIYHGHGRRLQPAALAFRPQDQNPGSHPLQKCLTPILSILSAGFSSKSPLVFSVIARHAKCFSKTGPQSNKTVSLAPFTCNTSLLSGRFITELVFGNSFRQLLLRLFQAADNNCQFTTAPQLKAPKVPVERKKFRICTFSSQKTKTCLAACWWRHSQNGITMSRSPPAGPKRGFASRNPTPPRSRFWTL